MCTRQKDPSKIFKLEIVYRLHDMEPVLVSLPLDFGKYVNRGIRTASCFNDDLSTDNAMEEELGDSEGEQHPKEKRQRKNLRWVRNNPPMKKGGGIQRRQQQGG
jgi:methyl coenzyme M reductase subunit C